MNKDLHPFIPHRNRSRFKLTHFSSGVAGAFAAALALPSITGTASAEDAAAPPPAQSRVHALINFEFSDKYLTPRGMIVQDEGIVFQPLVLGFANVYKGESFINDVTVVGGVWNCFGSGRLPSSDSGGGDRTSWYEIDPIAGLSFTFAKNFTLDVTYTAFSMQIFNIPFSQHLETKLSFNDSPFLGKFALHPYVSFWKELEGKATAAQVPFGIPRPQPGPGTTPGSSHYFEAGIAPSYTFESAGLKLELPVRVMLPDSEFYGEYYDDSSAIGLWEIGTKATIPLKFMPEGYGNWSFHAGFKYMKFEDENLASMQEFNAPGKKKDDVVQFFCGISTFF